MHHRFELTTLGALALRDRNGRPIQSVSAQPKRMALLIYLALARPRGRHQRETLLAKFWGEREQERARKALRQALYYLRSSLGDDVIETVGDTEVGINRELLRVDVVALDEALREERFEDALALYGGELLPGFHVDDAPEFERWLDSERG
jgi:DNA-binding SARP family transcriptional activator